MQVWNLQNPPALLGFQEKNIVCDLLLFAEIEVPHMSFYAFVFTCISIEISAIEATAVEDIFLSLFIQGLPGYYFFVEFYFSAFFHFLNQIGQILSRFDYQAREGNCLERHSVFKTHLDFLWMDHSFDLEVSETFIIVDTVSGKFCYSQILTSLPLNRHQLMIVIPSEFCYFFGLLFVTKLQRHPVTCCHCGCELRFSLLMNEGVNIRIQIHFYAFQRQEIGCCQANDSCSQYSDTLV